MDQAYTHTAKQVVLQVERHTTALLNDAENLIVSN